MTFLNKFPWCDYILASKWPQVLMPSHQKIMVDFWVNLLPTACIAMQKDWSVSDQTPTFRNSNPLKRRGHIIILFFHQSQTNWHKFPIFVESIHGSKFVSVKQPTILLVDVSFYLILAQISKDLLHLQRIRHFKNVLA